MCRQRPPLGLPHSPWAPSGCPSTTTFLVRIHHSSLPISFSPHCPTRPSPNLSKMGQERRWVGDSGSCRATSTAHPLRSPRGFGLRTRSRARGQKSTYLLCASDSQKSPSTDTEPTCKEGFVWPKVGPFCCFFCFMTVQ